MDGQYFPKNPSKIAYHVDCIKSTILSTILFFVCGVTLNLILNVVLHLSKTQKGKMRTTQKQGQNTK